MVGTGSLGRRPLPARPSPSTSATPMPRKVSASPDTIWSAWKWMHTMACSSASSAPAPIAASRPSHGLPVVEADPEAGQRAHEHHPLDAQVDDPGALREDLAERREQQDGARGDPRREDDLEVHRRTSRTR